MATAAGSRYAYVVDPPVLDELSPSGHLTGLPDVSRKAGFHALNQRAVALRESASLGKPMKDCSFIVCHLGAEVSIGAHQNGVVVEVNDIRSGTGPMSLNQSGSIPPAPLVDLCFSGRYSQDELKALILRNGGFKAHLDTDDIDEVLRRVRAGDRKAILTLEAFMTQIVREVGGCAAVLGGHIDAIILTGDLAKNEFLLKQISDKVSWIARVVAYPGEDDLRALVEGVLRVMRGVEDAKSYA
jgi:butyrate kinase